MKRKTPVKRLLAILVLLILLAASITISVIAYYVRSTGNVTNTFSPAESVRPTVLEEFDNTVKKNVKIHVGNTDYPVYVRAAIVITWIDADGNTVFLKPVKAEPVLDPDGQTVTGYEGDYILDLNLTDGWVLHDDGYYYFQKPVESNKETGILINKCEPNGDTGDLTLSVEVIAQTIQAVGYTDIGEIPAYQDAWGLSLNFDKP